MSSDFNFGWNDPANNSAPWGRATEAGGESPEKRKDGYPATDPASVSFSEVIGYRFIALINDNLQIDNFLKSVTLKLNSFREEIRNMAQAPAPQAGNGASGKSQNQNGKPAGPRSGLQFLKVEGMTRTPTKAKIMDYQIPEAPVNGGRQFNDVVLKLYYGGGMVLWGLKTTSPHYKSLYELFGGDFDDWREKEFMLGTEVRDFDQRVFAHVEPCPAPASGGKKGK